MTEGRYLIANYYDRLAATHGHTPQAVDAPDQAALDVRYQALGDVTDMNGKTVLDVGCGYGGLGAYLTHRYPNIDYHGIDISQGLIDLGREAHPELTLTLRDLLDLADAPSYDVVIAQGIFYRLESTEAPSTMVRRMFTIAREAVAFTSLSTWKPHRAAGELHIDPADTLKFCRRLTSRVVLRHDYHPGDLAIYLYKETP
jgi:trans-aconitate methyltransferase